MVNATASFGQEDEPERPCLVLLIPSTIDNGIKLLFGPADGKYYATFLTFSPAGDQISGAFPDTRISAAVWSRHMAGSSPVFAGGAPRRRSRNP